MAFLAAPLAEAVGGRILGGIGAKLGGKLLGSASARVTSSRMGNFLGHASNDLTTAAENGTAARMGQQVGFQAGLNNQRGTQFSEGATTGVNPGVMYG